MPFHAARQAVRRALSRLGDRIPLVCLTHPFELGLGIALLATLVRGLLAGQVTPSIDATLPDVPRIMYQAVSGLAGIAIVTGLTVRERHRGQRAENMGRAIERAGLYLAAGAFLGYSIVLGGTTGGKAFVNVIVSVAIGLACILRGVAIRRSELIELEALRSVNRAEDGGE